jgi:transcriptional regulator with XRE-family HTH domain
MMQNLAKKIKLMRQRNGWSQGDVAKKLDISVPAYSKIETGVTDINLSRLEQLVTIFDSSVVELLTAKTMDQNNVYIDELKVAHEKLSHYSSEILSLQEQVISLHEELRLNRHTV